MTNPLYCFIFINIILQRLIYLNLIAKNFTELTTSELYEILKARTEVFLLEQNIICQDMDDVDYNSLHCFFTEERKVIAYLRAYYVGDGVVKVGRVLTLTHGAGNGKELMFKSIEAIKAKMPCKKITVNAQKHAIGFYEKFGFRVTSDEFLEEGVVHIAMELNLTD